MEIIEKVVKYSQSQKGGFAALLEAFMIPDVVLPRSVAYPSPKGYGIAGHIPPPPGTETNDSQLTRRAILQSSQRSSHKSTPTDLERPVVTLLF